MISGRAANPEGGRRTWSNLRCEGAGIMPHPSGEFNAPQLKTHSSVARAGMERPQHRIANAALRGFPEELVAKDDG